VDLRKGGGCSEDGEERVKRIVKNFEKGGKDLSKKKKEKKGGSKEG